MNILHFYLGPYRRGGLSRYVNSLALSQAESGHEITLLYPGNFSFFKKTCIKREKNWNNISSFSVINPPPLPLFSGIKKTEWFLENMFDLPEKELGKLYDSSKPDILHIHTWMGFPKALLDFFKKKNVTIVFTTHDYFGLCPKVNFIDYNKNFCNEPSGSKCAICNRHAPGLLFLSLRNHSILLHIMKIFPDFTKPFITFLKKISGKRKSPNTQNNLPPVSSDMATQFESLLEYYKNLLKKVDAVNFNSSLTEKIYTSRIKNLQGKIIPLTHTGIQDYRSLRIYSQTIRFGFIGSDAPYKGLPSLLKIFNELTQEGYHNWRLDIWGNNTTIQQQNIYCHGMFSQKEQRSVYENMDMLLLTPLCQETFSFVVLEACSYGIPVLITENVGAKDILGNYTTDFICHDIKDIKAKLISILKNPDCLTAYNHKICKGNWLYSTQKHQEIIEQFYRSIR